MAGGATYYRVTVYVKEFRSDSAIVVYYGSDKEIALAYVQGYAGNGKYVHLTEECGKGQDEKEG